MHAVSWRQRVMAHMRPPPESHRLRGPLRFLIANLSSANWTKDFGTPEVMMMRTLASRAPQLFRKNVVSVDILTESEEQTLEVISSCFSMAGGVPELGLGNAEVNVLFSTWNMHEMLFRNSKRYWRSSIIGQVTWWTLAIVTTFIAIFQGEITRGGKDPEGENLIQQWSPEYASEVASHLGMATLILPVIAAFVSNMNGFYLWRDRWSVCIMAASQLVAEIYNFRMLTNQYDFSSAKQPTAEDGEKAPPLTAKEKARMARMTFVTRVQEFYGAAITEISQGFALRKRSAKVGEEEQHEDRLGSSCPVRAHALRVRPLTRMARAWRPCVRRWARRRSTRTG